MRPVGASGNEAAEDAQARLAATASHSAPERTPTHLTTGTVARSRDILRKTPPGQPVRSSLICPVQCNAEVHVPLLFR